MTNQIVNAAPMVIDRGTQDLSTRQVPRDPISVPQHLPKFYFFAQKGPTDPQIVVGADLTTLYGDETFNLRGKYANHSTVFVQGCNALGNAIAAERVVPTDAGPKSTLIAWLDVLPTQVDIYERNTDGSIKLDAITGLPNITGNAPGYKVKWVVDFHDTTKPTPAFGQLTIQPGTQSSGQTQSQKYPMFELEYNFVGEQGNNNGIRLWAPTLKNSTSLPTKLMTQELAYPFNIQMIERAKSTATPTVVRTLNAEQSVMFTFKPDSIDPLTEVPVYANDIIIQSYQNLEDPTYGKTYGPFGQMHVYQDNIDTLLAQFHAAEATYINEFSDFTSDASQKYLFNFVTGVSSFGVPYNTFIFVDASDTTRWSDSTNVYAAGGSDGTLTDEKFAEQVALKVAAYSDLLDPYQDLVANPESIIYDSGFDLATKYELIKFISRRRDTFVVLSTFDVNDRTLTASEEQSIAIALRTRLQMYPESDYFGTEVMRGLIMGYSGKIRNSLWKKRMPLTYEVMRKAARYMGAGDGRWKNGYSFTGAPGSIVQDMTDISITWVPASVRNRNWDAGLNWVQKYDLQSYFFPAFKTVYGDDTSVLNSFTTAMAICQLNKVAHAAWREYSGRDDLSGPQLVQRVNDFVTDKTNYRFDERYIIRPDAQITDMDNLRGFSWTLPIKIGADSMRTTMTTYVQAFRKEDLTVTP